MEEQSPTYLRANLYKTLEKVAVGFKVRIKAKTGNFILIAEKDFKKQSRKDSKHIMEPKAEGKIISTLDDADTVLRQHIRIPS